jgi:hypothetical protein
MTNKQSSIYFYKCQSDELIDKYMKMEISKMEFLSLHHYLFYQASEIHKAEMIDFALDCQEMFEHQIEEKFTEKF